MSHQQAPKKMTRYALALDLVNDDPLISDYEKAHEEIWPEVREHLNQQGVIQMTIYRLGTRLFMLMDVNPQIYAPERMAQAALDNPAIVRWEALMWTFQVATPWTPKGDKWTLMTPIFELNQSPGVEASVFPSATISLD